MTAWIAQLPSGKFAILQEDATLAGWHKQLAVFDTHKAAKDYARQKFIALAFEERPPQPTVAPRTPANQNGLVRSPQPRPHRDVKQYTLKGRTVVQLNVNVAPELHQALRDEANGSHANMGVLLEQILTTHFAKKKMAEQMGHDPDKDLYPPDVAQARFDTMLRAACFIPPADEAERKLREEIAQDLDKRTHKKKESQS